MLLLSEFGANAATNDKLAYHCLVCARSQYEPVKQSPEELLQNELIKNGQKKCSQCAIIKSIDEFRSISDTLRRADCRDCEKIRDYKYKEKHKERLRNKQRQKHYDNPAKSLFIIAKNRAKRAGINFDITLDYINDLWKKGENKCILSNIPFDFSLNDKLTFSRRPFGPSLDRIDGKRGYEKGNVRFILGALNVAINEFGIEIYTQIANAVLNNLTNRFEI